MPRPKPALILADDERQKLLTLARRPKSTQRLAQRARIVLACADEPNNRVVARRLGLCAATVGTWRSRFVARRLDGLVDEPRPGAPRAVTDADVERVVTRTLECRPPAATHWSTRGMARASGLSQSAVSRIWRAFGLKPHLQDTFKLSADPFFVEKVRDVVGPYPAPPARAIVLSGRREEPSAGAGPHPAAAPDDARRRPGSGGRTTTSGTARRPCSPPWTWRPAR